MPTREQTLFRFVTALDALAVLVLVLFLVERSRWASPVSDRGVLIGMVSLFVVLPPAPSSGGGSHATPRARGLAGGSTTAPRRSS